MPLPPIPPKTEHLHWSFDIEKVDTVQSRAQVEALRAIAEELRRLNWTLWRLESSGAFPASLRKRDR